MRARKDLEEYEKMELLYTKSIIALCDDCEYDRHDKHIYEEITDNKRDYECYGCGADGKYDNVHLSFFIVAAKDLLL